VWLPLLAGMSGVCLFYRSGLCPHDLTCGIGIFLCLLGLAIGTLARYELGRSFSVRAKATELVTTGIYSRIRNPIYVSSAIVAVGIILMFRHPVFLVFLVLIPVQMIRARREARVLEANFGEAYRQYRARTWF
jgi:protein-S-isoprenylcysteine O-methyltransferase Ste14